MILIRLICLFICLQNSLKGETEASLLEQAHQSYLQGEQATQFEQQQVAFNRALQFYDQLAQQTAPASASLNRVLADTYFQLGAYPWAILYYQRALKGDPYQNETKGRLNQAYEALDLAPPTQQFSLLEQLLLFPWISAKQRWIFFFIITCATFLLWAWVIWFPTVKGRQWGWISSALYAFFLLYLIFVYYVTPLEVVVVKSTGFYQLPAWEGSPLSTDPLPAGINLRLLQVTSEGEWLKVTDGHLIGYVPARHTRLI